jgi:hypothetical protein
MIGGMENDGQSSKGRAPRPLGTDLGAVCTSDAGSYGGETLAGAWVGEAAARVVKRAEALRQLKPGSRNPAARLYCKLENRRRNRMRILTALALTLALASPAMAQALKDHPNVEALALKLKANPAMAADKPNGGPQVQPMALMDPGAAAAPKAGWNNYSMGVCIAAIAGGEQFLAAIATTGEAMVTQSTYALGVVAANCASGKTFWVYLENDLQTITAIGSYPR